MLWLLLLLDDRLLLNDRQPVLVELLLLLLLLLRWLWGWHWLLLRLLLLLGPARVRWVLLRV